MDKANMRKPLRMFTVGFLFLWVNGRLVFGVRPEADARGAR